MRARASLPVLMTAFALGACSAAEARAQTDAGGPGDWAQWRGPTRDGKSLPVKRPSHGPSSSTETRAWEAQTPVRRNRHDRPQPAWAHDSDEEEDGCRITTSCSDFSVTD